MDTDFLSDEWYEPHRRKIVWFTAVREEKSIGCGITIDALVERGDLHEVTGRERGRIYEAPRIFDAVYGPVDVGEPAPDPQLTLDLGTQS